MRLTAVENLNTGDVLARAVYTTSGRVVLNTGISLSDKYISKLRQIGIHKVYIEDDRFNDIEVTDTIDLKLQNSAMQIIKDAYDGVHKGKEIDEYLIKGIANDIVDYVRESKDKGVSILTNSAVDDYIIEHSINTAILSAFMANRMDFNYHQLCDLVIGALIHDIGRDNERDEKPEHAQKGFDVMRRYRGLNLHSSIVCYEHHENFDGSGYPRKLKGSAISIYSRVIRTADFYDTVLHGYDNNDLPTMPHQAFESVLAVSGSIIDPDMVKIFRDTIVFYPNGCTVLLSNGLKGLVIRQNAGSPQRPVVRVFNDSSVLGEIDLVKSLTIFIKDVVVA